tara:strand:+ start:5557 stop:6519 length:963 start_codon:yes stop_codon:yes gene_type:complete
MNFVVLYCVKNQYEMFEEFIFKHSPVDFKEVKILIFDDNSLPKQKELLKNLCKKHNNIIWINPLVNTNSSAPIFSAFECADNYLINENISSNWMLFFENDCFPFQKNFWGELNKTINKYDWLDKKVGLFGFSNYQHYNNGEKIFAPGNPVPGRGCLVKGILNPPHSGWYKDLPKEYYKSDYFVLEVPNWQSVCVNRKLFRDKISLDVEYKGRLLNTDDIAHQFMVYNTYNICFPKLSVYHDSGKLKKNIKLISDPNYSRSINVHEVFENRWGWKWGKRNVHLRYQFENVLNNSDFYDNTIQEKLFKIHINEGPKKIEDFE